MLANNTGLSGKVVAMLNMAESTPLGFDRGTPLIVATPQFTTSAPVGEEGDDG
jgi:hypothetical protein